ncbi:MAG: hypothetical protein R2729_27885 [Bryobacteraceae bacterium]
MKKSITLRMLVVAVWLQPIQPAAAQPGDSSGGYCANWMVLSLAGGRPLGYGRCSRFDDAPRLIARYSGGRCYLCDGDDWFDLRSIPGRYNFGSHGVMTVSVSGSRFFAKYGGGKGELTGTIEGNRATGTYEWRESSSGGVVKGTFELTFEPGSASGSWTQKDPRGRQNVSWSGRKL